MPEFGFSRIKSGKIEPLEDNTYDIGKDTLRWKDIYLSGKAYASEFIGTVDYSNIRLPSGVWTNLNADELDGYHASDFALASHTHSRSDITDFFSSPFWDNIPDKPFSTLGLEFTVSSGELQVASIDFSKITNRVSSLITFDSSLVPNADGNYDLGNSGYHWRNGYFVGIVYADYYYTYDEVGNIFKLLEKDFGDTFTYLHILSNYSNPENKGAVTVYFGYNSKIRQYDFRSLWSGSNISMFSIDCVHYSMKYRGTLRPYVDNTYDIGDDSYRWRNGYFAGFLDVGSLRIGGTEVIASGRVLQNVTADASIITSGTLAWERIAENFPRYAEEVINSISMQGWLEFDGENDYALIDPFSVNSQSVTVIVMINTKSVPQVGWDRKVPIRLNFPSFAITIRLVPSTGNIEVGTAGPGYDIRYVETAVLNEWQVWAIRITDGNTLSVFKNGSKVFTYSKTYPDEDSELLSLGGVYQFVASTAYNGGIAYVFVYSPALSDEEIQQICKDPTNPPTDGLVLWLDGSSIDYANRIWRDKSGNGNDAVIYGAVPGGFPPKFHTHSSADIVYNSSLIPSSDNAFDIGTESLRWRNAYFAGDVQLSPGSKIYYDSAWYIQLVAEDSGDWGQVFSIFNASGRHFRFRDSSDNTLLYIQSGADGGKVGIGVIPSTFKLEVKGSIGASADNTYDLGSNSYMWRSVYAYEIRKASDFAIKFDGENLVFYEPEDSNAVAYQILDAGAGGNFTHEFYSSGLRLKIDSSGAYVDGNVGIGTTSPEYKLHVYSGVNDGILVESSGDHPRVSLKGFDGTDYWTLTLEGQYHGRALAILFPTGGYYLEIVPFMDATDTNIRLSPAKLLWRGKYWDGSSSKNFDFQIIPEVLDTTPTGRLRFNLPSVGDILILHSSEGVQVGSNLKPVSDNAYDIGNSSYRWKSVYAGKFYVYTPPIDMSVNNANSSPDTQGSNWKILLGPWSYGGYWEYGIGIEPNTLWFSAFIRHRFYTRHPDPDAPYNLMMQIDGSARLTSFATSVLPFSDNAYNIGNSTYRWKDGYFAGTVYASQFEGNIDWSYVVNKPNLIIGDGTKYVFVGSTEPTATQVGDIWIETY